MRGSSMTQHVPHSAAQLTMRAVLAGMCLGAVMCLSNIYVFFKTGWSLGVTLTACLLAFAALFPMCRPTEPRP